MIESTTTWTVMCDGVCGQTLEVPGRGFGGGCEFDSEEDLRSAAEFQDWEEVDGSWLCFDCRQK